MCHCSIPLGLEVDLNFPPHTPPQSVYDGRLLQAEITSNVHVSLPATP